MKLKILFCLFFVLFQISFCFAFDTTSICDQTRFEDERLYYNSGIKQCSQISNIDVWGIVTYNAYNSFLSGPGFLLETYVVNGNSLSNCTNSDNVHSKPDLVLGVFCVTLNPSLQVGSGVESNYSKSDCSQMTVTGVSVGGEAAASATSCAPVFASLTSPASMNGYAHTGNDETVSYYAELDTNGTTCILHVSCCKRGGYTATDGTVVPLGSLGGGGSGGGGSTPGTGVSSPGSPLGTAGDPLHVTGGSAGGGTGTVTANELKDGMGDTSSYTGDSNLASWEPKTAFNTPDQSFTAMKDSFNTFKSGLASSSLFSSHTSFFSAAGNVGAGSAPVMTVHGGHTFGDHNFDFGMYTPWLAILKKVMLVVFAFISIRIVVLKGGVG
jgi:hypothetical protein